MVELKQPVVLAQPRGKGRYAKARKVIPKKKRR